MIHIIVNLSLSMYGVKEKVKAPKSQEIYIGPHNNYVCTTHGFQVLLLSQFQLLIT